MCARVYPLWFSGCHFYFINWRITEMTLWQADHRPMIYSKWSFGADRKVKGPFLGHSSGPHFGPLVWINSTVAGSACVCVSSTSATLLEQPWLEVDLKKKKKRVGQWSILSSGATFAVAGRKNRTNTAESLDRNALRRHLWIIGNSVAVWETRKEEDTWATSDLCLLELVKFHKKTTLFTRSYSIKYNVGLME